MGNIERAEQMGRMRLVLMALVAILLLVILAYAPDATAPDDRPFGVAQSLLFATIALGAAVVLATGGGLAHPRAIRSLLNDEVARANRSRALGSGFWVALAIALVGYLGSIPGSGLPQVTAHGLALTILLGSEAAALAHFVWLEAAAYRHG